MINNDEPVKDYNSHKSLKNDKKGYITLIITLICCYVGRLCLITNYTFTDTLWSYFLYTIIEGILNFIHCIIVSYFFISFLSIFKIDIKVVKNTVIFSIVIFCLFEIILQQPRVSIYNDKPTSKLNYKYAILSDIVLNKTNVIETNNIQIQKEISKVFGAGRHKRIIYYPSSISYGLENDTSNFSTQINSDLINIVKRLISLEDNLKIEYYENSKIIKKIDEIEIYDYNALNNRLVYLENYHKRDVY